MGRKQQYKLLIRIIAIVQNASWGGFLIGYTSSELALSSDNVALGLGADSIETSQFYNKIFLIVLPFGGLIGTILYYYLSQLTSRRNIILISDVIFILGSFIGYNKSFTFALLRFFQGISNAFNFCGVLLYIREIVPDKWADKAVILFQINLNIGILMANVLGLPLPLISEAQFEDAEGNRDYLWRVIFIFPILFSLLRIYCLIFVYDFETPFYYFQMNQPLKESKLIKFLYHESYVKEAESNICQIGRQEESLSATYHQRKYYSMLILAIQQLTGINVGIYSTNTLQTTFNANKIISVFSSIFLLLSAIAAYKFESQIKQKTKTIGIGFIILFFLNLLLIFSIELYSQYTYFIGISLFYIVFNFTAGPLCLSIVSDLNKEKGIAVSFISYWISNIISTFIGQYLNPKICTSIFTFFCLLGFFLFFFKNKETKSIPFHQLSNSQKWLKVL